ncbi:zinc finger protein 425-like [Anopheles maculipalpis]|uniref:zinc finger protein 425-like n=1 Tax=Anopheles maculipalpis TaxID=1496333 RepID=UPI0021592E0B|nr:zinc finger protein 425-like [Anopheles maculipalpis]
MASSRIGGRKRETLKSKTIDSINASKALDESSDVEILYPPPQVKLEPHYEDITIETTTADDLADSIKTEEYTITEYTDTANDEENYANTADKASPGTLIDNSSDEVSSDTEETSAIKSQPSSKAVASIACDQCERSFVTRVQLKNHMRMHKISECPICKKSLKRASFKVHLAAHEAKFRCDICEAPFGSFNSLQSHKDLRHATKTQSGDETFSCSMCDRKFTNKTQLSCHRKQHKRRQCPICMQQVPSMILQGHIAIHQQAHYCDLCNRSFASASILTRHKRVKHSTVKQSVLVCEQCGLAYPSAAKLHNHRKMHQRKECPICKKTFRPNKIKEHLASHNGAFRCDSCRKSFTTKYCLNRHSRRHSTV